MSRRRRRRPRRWLTHARPCRPLALQVWAEQNPARDWVKRTSVAVVLAAARTLSAVTRGEAPSGSMAPTGAAHRARLLGFKPLPVRLGWALVRAPVATDSRQRFIVAAVCRQALSVPDAGALASQSLEAIEKTLAWLNDLRIAAFIVRRADGELATAMALPAVTELDALYEAACAVHETRLTADLPTADKCACGRPKDAVFHKTCSQCHRGGGGGYRGGYDRYDRDWEDSEFSDEYDSYDDEYY